MQEWDLTLRNSILDDAANGIVVVVQDEKALNTLGWMLIKRKLKLWLSAGFENITTHTHEGIPKRITLQVFKNVTPPILSYGWETQITKNRYYEDEIFI